MRGSAGSCASIRVRRCRPLREFELLSIGCQRFSIGVGTDRSSKANGFRDVGNRQSTVLTNLCAPQAVARVRTQPGFRNWVTPEGLANVSQFDDLHFGACQARASRITDSRPSKYFANALRPADVMRQVVRGFRPP